MTEPIMRIADISINLLEFLLSLLLIIFIAFTIGHYFGFRDGIKCAEDEFCDRFLDKKDHQ